MHKDDIAAAVERLNAVAEIPAIAPSLIEAMWNGINCVPREERQRMMMTGVMVDPTQIPEQTVALSLRYGLLDALIERGALDDYMMIDSERCKVFTAAATFPCNAEDLLDAMSQRIVRESPEQAAQKTKELTEEGYDLDQPKVVEVLKQWMREHC